MKRISVAVLGTPRIDPAALAAEVFGCDSVTVREHPSRSEREDCTAVFLFSGNASGEISPSLAADSVGHPHLRVIAGESVGAEEASFLFELRALTSGTESERKFLVTYPDLAALEETPCAAASRIVQTYLRAEEGVTARVRMREADGDVTYTHTEKRRIDRVSSEEREEEISESEYRALLLKSDPSKKPVEKVRWCILYGGRYFELDVYPFWSDRAVVELEYAAPDDAIPVFPPYFRLIREVTDDVRYKNVRLAENVPYDEIG